MPFIATRKMMVYGHGFLFATPCRFGMVRVLLTHHAPRFTAGAFCFYRMVTGSMVNRESAAMTLGRWNLMLAPIFMNGIFLALIQLSTVLRETLQAFAI